MNSLIRRAVNRKSGVTFELMVRNFSQVVQDLKYNSDDIDNTKFTLVVKPRVVLNDVEYLSIQFSNSKTFGGLQRRVTRKYYQLSIGVIDRNANIVNKRCSPFLALNTIRSEAMQGWDRFIERNQVLNPHSDLLTGDRLTLLCHFEVCDEIQSVFSDSQSIANAFEKCYKSLLNDHELSDFTVVVNEREFPVHKSVLAARSPVFRAMIATDMREKKESKVVLHDIDEEVVEQLLVFIYTGSAPKVRTLANKLSTAADFFDMPDLKMSCAQTLFSELSEDNVMEAISFGETHGIRELVLNAIDFIGENREKVRSKIIQRA